MNVAKLGVFGLLASAAALYGFTGDTAQKAPAAAVSAPVNNFLLVDQNFEAHELYRLSDAKAVVIVTQANGDAVIRGLAPQLKALKAKYGPQGVEFFLLNSKDKFDTVKPEADKAGYDWPVLIDDNQIIGESLGVTKTWRVVAKTAAADGAKALDAALAGQQVASDASRGAAVPMVQVTKVSYAKDVAPILEAKCVACHQEGGIGPMQLTSYQMVKGFAPMIREVIRTDRMPPYHADPHVGQFSDSKRLTSDEIKTIVHWVEDGAPRGDGADPLAAAKHVAQEWPLGKPDVILKIPSYTVPASGLVDYQRPAIMNPLTEGKWLRASTVKPGDRQAVHHVLTGWMPSMPEGGKSSETRWQGSVGGYAVGAESEVMPANTGSYIPPSGAIGFQMHYTPYGKPTTDNSEIGLYFYDKPPELIMHSVVVIDNSIDIPAGDGHHQEVAYVAFPHDALLYSAFPHAHYRATASDLWLYTPDGKKTLLVTLPRYDFNWQREYTFKTPVKIPAGSKLVAHYVYDNSKRNPHNPDPKINVTWGEQSWQEMFFTSVRYRWTDETATHRVNYEAEMNANRLMGMMDDNIDGKLQKAELRGRVGEMLGKYFDVLDKDHDGSLDGVELAAAQQMMGNRGQRRDTAPVQSEAAQRAAAFNGAPTNNR